jgi:hypothetical protein
MWTCEQHDLEQAPTDLRPPRRARTRLIRPLAVLSLAAMLACTEDSAGGAGAPGADGGTISLTADFTSCADLDAGCLDGAVRDGGAPDGGHMVQDAGPAFLGWS